MCNQRCFCRKKETCASPGDLQQTMRANIKQQSAACTACLRSFCLLRLIKDQPSMPALVANATEAFLSLKCVSPANPL